MGGMVLLENMDVIAVLISNLVVVVVARFELFNAVALIGIVLIWLVWPAKFVVAGFWVFELLRELKMVVLNCLV